MELISPGRQRAVTDGRVTVGVVPADAVAHHNHLLAMLELVFAVRFVPWHAPDGPVDGLLVLRGDTVGRTEQTAPVLILSDDSESCFPPRSVQISADAPVDHAVRGMDLAWQFTGPARPALSGHAPLALGPDGPVWTRKPGRPTVDWVSSALPDLPAGMTVLEALHGPRSLALVALVEFLRAVGAERFARPGPRCAFVFDDPNLRRSRYGYIDYRKLLEHADAHGYHAAMAMIPLDARRRTRDAIALFRGRPDRLSLVIHGNNHTTSELMVTKDFASALALCAQSLRRIEAFESRTDVPVDRVMMPPHGGWSRDSARALGALGFDALCTTQRRPTTEGTRDEFALAGFSPAEFVDGCAVIPRLPLKTERMEIALRAFLGQPVVLYGHHDDLADGLESLESAASIVNSLGKVSWRRVGEIAQSNYEVRVTGEALEVRPWATRIRISVPDGIRTLRVHEPRENGSRAWLRAWEVSSATGTSMRFGESVPITEANVTVRLQPAWRTDFRDVASPPTSPRAVLRRRLTEARDQFAPNVLRHLF